MDCADVLHIIGDIASIITVAGGIYGFCKWIQSRKAEIAVTKHTNDSPFYYIDLVNNGPAIAYDIRLCDVESSQIIKRLQPSEAGQLSFVNRFPTSSLKVKISWRDGMGSHKKKVRIF